ncbi:MAG: hypothetical protein QGG36_30170 [Pirellulaceae bacterium]|jgi:hypothetical protein|nr:hypothetical protein [Pirellulaceae bacterium]
MTTNTSGWTCPNCGVNIYEGFDVCWACGTNRDGKADPDFEVATAPIMDVEDESPLPAWLAGLMILCFPAFLLYLLTRVFFPFEERRPQFTLTSLFVSMTVVAVLLGLWLFRDRLLGVG